MPSSTEKPSAPSSSTREPDEHSASAYMREKFEQGSRLAPFHWASLWKRGMIPGAVPQWVAEYLATLAADYYQGAQEATREGKKPKTLDELAGFSHSHTRAGTTGSGSGIASQDAHSILLLGGCPVLSLALVERVLSNPWAKWTLHRVANPLERSHRGGRREPGTPRGPAESDSLSCAAYARRTPC